MKTSTQGAGIQNCVLFRGGQFARFVRDEKPTRSVLLDWLQASNNGCFYELLKVGMLREVEEHIEWSPDFLSQDGRCLRFGNCWFWLDTNVVQTF